MILTAAYMTAGCSFLHLSANNYKLLTEHKWKLEQLTQVSHSEKFHDSSEGSWTAFGDKSLTFIQRRVQ